MARLPTPGGDSGNWGTILNTFLSQVHASDGTLKTDSVTSDAIAPNAVTSSALAPNAVDAITIADGSITETLLDTAVQTKLNATAPVTSVASKTGDVSLTKTDVGLDQVDNTSDATKNAVTATLTNKTISGASNTIIDLPASATPDAARLVCRTAAGSNGTENGANTWAKIATLTNPGSYFDTNILLSCVTSGYLSSTSETAILSACLNTGPSRYPSVTVMSKSGPDRFIGPDSFKIVSDTATGAGVAELWVKKLNQYGRLDFYELGRNMYNAGSTVTYHDGAPWQSTEPTGTAFNVISIGTASPSTVAASLRANTNIVGGGAISVASGGEVSWNSRFMVISNGNGYHFSYTGYFQIDVPSLGTVITGVGGASDRAVTANGIPMSGYEALYYILPVGSTSASRPENFRVVNYTGSLEIPHNWLRICVRIADNGNVYNFANGINLQPGQSLQSYQHSTSNVANTIVRRDDTGSFSAQDITAAGTITSGGATVVTTSSTVTLTNKTISGASNTLSNIPQAAITNLDMHLSSLRTGPNLVTNPGFELDLYLGAYGVYDTAVKRNGTRSVRIDSDGSAPNIYHVTDATASLNYPCQDGETFYFEEWVYGDAGNTQNTGWIELCIVTRNSANVQQWRNQQFAASTSYNGQWTKLSATLQISQADVQWVSFLTRLNAIPSGDSYWFDDPIVYRVGVPGSSTSPALLAAGGSDTNISLNIKSKGTGTVQANGVDIVTASGTQTLTNKTLTNPIINSIKDANGNNFLALTATSNSVNYFSAANAATGGTPTLYSVGTDTDIHLRLYPKGTGHVLATAIRTQGLYNWGGGTQSLAITGGASDVNYIGISSAATGSPIGLTAYGTDTNVNINLIPKGTGVVKINNIDITTISGTQTLTNKTITTPKIDAIKDANGNFVIGLSAQANAVNYLSLSNRPSPYNPYFAVVGSDADLDFQINPKGSGGLLMYVSTGQKMRLRASGADADVDINLEPRGSGTAQVNGSQITTISGAQTLTNKTLTAPTISGGSGTATIQAGNGSPEGVVTATVGSLYMRTDGGAGTTLYVKESGAGNTGWVAK